MVDLLASLPVPIVVALVTALVTSALSSKRAAADRVAQMRLEAYQESVLAAQKFQHRVSDMEAQHLEDVDDLMRASEELNERLGVLKIVASPRACKRAEECVESLNANVKARNRSRAEQSMPNLERTQDIVTQLVDVLIEEARREVRRARI